MTMAYASIRKPAWFDLQTAVFASEKIFDLVQRTSNGRFPPLSFLIEAWANTVNHFAEQVRVTGKPLVDFVLNTGIWEHKWTWTAPPVGGGGGAVVDLPRSLANDVADAAAQARQYQSLMDRQANDRRRATEGLTQTHGYGGGKNGRGKNTKGAGGKDNTKGKNHGNQGRGNDRVPDRRTDNYRERSRGRGNERR